MGAHEDGFSCRRNTKEPSLCVDSEVKRRGEYLTLQQFKEYVLKGHEIELTICDNPFFIGCAYSGSSQEKPNTVYNEGSKELFVFFTRENLWTEFKFHKQSLEQLWSNNDIIINCIY